MAADLIDVRQRRVQLRGKTSRLANYFEKVDSKLRFSTTGNNSEVDLQKKIANGTFLI
jgi:hypothetical protein